MNKIIITAATAGLLLIAAILSACAPATPPLPTTTTDATENRPVRPTNETTPAAATATPAQPLADAPTTAYGVTEIAAHNSPADCWVAANGQVYDITDFLAKHKSPLEKFCGQTSEFEQAYNAQHGTSKEDVLNAYQIGVLQ
jgi:hypothetical protein